MFFAFTKQESGKKSWSINGGVLTIRSITNRVYHGIIKLMFNSSNQRRYHKRKCEVGQEQNNNKNNNKSNSGKFHLRLLNVEEEYEDNEATVT